MSDLLAHLDGLSFDGLGHSRLFLACSGGRDSLSLAWACHLLYQKGRLSTKPTLLHVHHGMQSANDDWATFVKSWADEHEFVCHVLAVVLDKKNETHARHARYHAMMSVMNHDDVLLLAHHQNDQAETLLIRLINGTGIHGLSGMKAWQNKTIGNKTIRLHRPWLSVRRQDISDFAHAHALPYVDDPTNDTTDNARSFIRNDILPRLASLNPQVCTNIARSATLIAQSTDILQPIITSSLQQCSCQPQSDPPYQSVLDIGVLSGFDDAHQSAILHAWLGAGETNPPPSHIIKDIFTLAQRQDPDQHAQIFWQGQRGYVVCRYRQHLYRFWDKAWAYLNRQSTYIKSTNTQKNNPNHHAITLTLPDHDSAHLIERTDKVTIHIHGTPRQLHGKKLYQHLGIAPFFRPHLYLISKSIKHQTHTWLIAPYQSWQLSGAPCHTDGLRWQQAH